MGNALSEYSLTPENLFKGPVGGAIAGVILYALYDKDGLDLCVLMGHVMIGTFVGTILGPWILPLVFIFAVVRFIKNHG